MTYAFTAAFLLVLSAVASEEAYRRAADKIEFPSAHRHLEQ